MAEANPLWGAPRIHGYDACTQRAAIAFIDEVLHRLPFRVLVVQTDNGAEFQSHFHRTGRWPARRHTNGYWPKRARTCHRRFETLQHRILDTYGRICFHGRKINLSHALAGQNVGVTHVDDHLWLVTFMHYDLGYFDDEAGRVEPIAGPFGSKVLPMCSE